MTAPSMLSPATEAGRRHATLWLALASAAVAASGLFAVLIALARVPALGNLFPGAEFYRVALTLHVNLSQGVWFMAFAGVLWSLAAVRPPQGIDRLAWAMAAGGAAGMAVSVSIGRPEPLMSNYLPVLDSPVFLTALSMFGAGVLIAAVRALAGPMETKVRQLDGVRRFILRIAALEVVAVFILLGATALAIAGQAEGYTYFETLFWGSGHVWQFALVSLMMLCWIELAPAASRSVPPGLLRALVIVGALPVLAALVVPALHSPDSAAHAYAYTWLMRWTLWEAPLAMGAILLVRGMAAPGFALSLALFMFGLLLGAAINGQTTLITAHYHGTIGAVTLAFMAASFVLLPRLGIDPPSSRAVRVQLGLYGYGVLLMMAGLAGAGLMGAPRKTPGDLTLSWSVETVSRVCLGLGGVLATLGIMMFAVLLLRRLFPIPTAVAYSR